MRDMPTPRRQPNYAHKRPAPAKAAGWGKPVTEDVKWTRIVDPPERYRIVYIDRDALKSERIIELRKIGSIDDTPYLGVMHEGRFKTLRADRVAEVREQLTSGHAPSICAQPTYATKLPAFPLANAVYRVPTIVHGNRTWTVDLNRYTCTCPEKRIRSAMGYEPGVLGFVCLHVARAILENLPADAPGWTPEVLRFLNNRRLIHVDNLI